MAMRGLFLCLMSAATVWVAAQTVVPTTTVRYEITAKQDTRQILAGNPTPVWRYVVGPSVTGVNTPAFPILRVKKGSTLEIKFRNQLPEATTIHWHGLDVPASMDGHPKDSIPAGATFTYRFPILNRAGTYWFHPHPDMRTAYQVAQGLAGVIIVSDDEEEALNLPKDRRDVTMVIQDRVFNSSNQIVYSPSVVAGYLGNRILVNGAVNAQIPVSGRTRMRLINGSNARIYKLAWSDGSPMRVIGTDQGLLSAPVTRNYVMMAPGERVELLEIFPDFNVSPRKLISQAFTPGGPTGGGGLAQGAAFDVATLVNASGLGPEPNPPVPAIPTTLSSTVPNYTLAQATNAANPRVIALSMVGQAFHLNGGAFSMNTVASNELVKLGEVQVWEFRNDTPVMMMSHPVHLHSSGFKVLDRTWLGTQMTAVNSMKDGLLDEGFKDTFLLMPGERVRVLFKPLYYTGRFLYHCHNLEHEDMGMMRNFDVIP